MPPRQVQKFVFPSSGLSENFGYETQPPGTTVSAQNVRAYDESTGRLRGGQRPGLKTFVSDKFDLTNTTGTNSKSFQSLLQLTGTDVSETVGDMSLSIPLRDTGASNATKVLTNKDFPGATGSVVARRTSSIVEPDTPANPLVGSVDCMVYDKAGNLYVAHVDHVDEGGSVYQIGITKISHTDGSQTRANLAYAGSATTHQHKSVGGIGHWNGHLYLLLVSFTGDSGSDYLLSNTSLEVGRVVKVKDDLSEVVEKSDAFAAPFNGTTAGSVDYTYSRNQLAVGHDRLYVVGCATNEGHKIRMFCWRLGVQSLSSSPTSVTVKDGTEVSSPAGYPLEVCLGNKGDAFVAYRLLDNGATTYYISKVKRDFSGLDTDYGTSGTVTGTNAIYSIAYCTRTDRLAVSGATDGTTGVFSGISSHVAMLQKSTGTVAAPSNGSAARLISGVNSWGAIHVKSDGELVLSRIKTGTTMEVVSTTKVYEEFLSATEGGTSATNVWNSVVADGGKADNNKVYDATLVQLAGDNKPDASLLTAMYNIPDVDYGEKTTMRQSNLVGVGEGNVRVMEVNSSAGERDWEDINGGTNALDHSCPVIFGIPFYGTQNATSLARTTTDPFQRLAEQKAVYAAFYVDGRNKQLYDFYDNKVKGWVSNKNIASGSAFPRDAGGMYPTLIESWRGRIVMSGVQGEPHNWFMTAIGTTDDWEYLPTVPTEYTAVAGHVSDAGEMPDVVRGMIPFSDDVMLFLGDRSIWQLSGDPQSGGRFDLLSDKVGGAWGRAWCKDTTGTAYFFGSTGGVYRIAPRSYPEKITAGVIDKRLRDIDLSNTVVRMEWSEKAQGVHLFFTKNDTTSIEDCLFYDARSGSWWPDNFAHIAHNSANVMVFDGDVSGDREVLIGGRDGNVYKFDPDQVRDQTDTGLVDIDSHVYLGPIGKGQRIVVDELSGKLALDSGTVNWSLYAGSSAEAALPGDVVGDDVSDTTRGLTGTGSWAVSVIDGDNIGKNVDRMRAVGDSIYLKLYNDSSPTKRWAFEAIEAQYHPVGRQSSRLL